MTESAAIQQHIRYAQSRSKVPLLVASNPEMGGFGSCDDGTLVSTHLQAGSHPDASIAYRMGQVAGREIAALGCNWAFAPIVDIHRNWRNTVVATRSFGNDADLVIERATQFFDGISESPDGLRDQAFPRRRRRRARSARRHDLQHARRRRVARDVRHVSTAR